MTTTSGERRVAILFHESEVLGAGLSILRASEELKGRGWRLSGWFPGPGPLPDEARALLQQQEEHVKPIAFSVRGWRRAPGLRARLTATPGYLRAVREWLVALDATVVHANSLLMLPEATVARRLGVPVVLQVHELRAPGLKRRATIRWAAAVADVLVGVSGPVTAMLLAHAGRTPVVTVHNGVPPARATATTSTFVVGTVGYVSRTKGTDVFLHAAELALRSSPGLRFEHVGPHRLWGDEVFDRSIDELAASPTLRSTVSFLGRSSVEHALARWSVFVLASRQEGFPLSTLEAMAAGLPVVATNVGGVPEQISHLETGILVAAEDHQAIADWIVRLHDDPALRMQLGETARRRVREAFTLEAQADGLAAAYEEALRRTRARQPPLAVARRSGSSRKGR